TTAHRDADGPTVGGDSNRTAACGSSAGPVGTRARIEAGTASGVTSAYPSEVCTAATLARGNGYLIPWSVTRQTLPCALAPAEVNVATSAPRRPGTATRSATGTPPVPVAAGVTGAEPSDM